MGVTAKYKLTDKSHTYGQFIIDEFKISEIRAGKGWWANKYAGQIGFKVHDILGVDNLCFQTEFNASRPYMYSHHKPLQSYTHYGQPLAHPLGSSFYENHFGLKKEQLFQIQLQTLVSIHYNRIVTIE